MSRYLLYGALSVLLVLSLLALNLVTFSGRIEQRLIAHYYLVLGDSIAYGYQPNLIFTQGFADDVTSDLQGLGVSDDFNYACPGEDTVTMIEGGCPSALFHHESYIGAQLDAVIAFAKNHRGNVGPVTLAIGSNDVLSDYHSGSCSVSQSANADLARMDQNLTQVILPRLVDALSVAPELYVPALNMLNYYDPYARQCPASLTFVKTLNAHLAADAMPFGIPMIDVFAAFGGDTHMAANVCTLTWYCDSEFQFDLHPTSQGYRIIANAIEQTLGYQLTVGRLSSPAQAAVVQPEGTREHVDLPSREHLA